MSDKIARPRTHSNPSAFSGAAFSTVEHLRFSRFYSSFLPILSPLSVRFAPLPVSGWCFFAAASSRARPRHGTARKKINTRQVRRHKASPRRGNYVGPVLCALASVTRTPPRVLYELLRLITKGSLCTMTSRSRLRNRETLANASLLVRLIAMVNKVKLSFGHGIGLRYTDEPRSVYRTVYCWEFVAPAIG